jgi:hypothetical protein
VRDAERVRHRAGAEHGLRRAAGLGPVGLRIGPELQRHAEHLRPALALEQRRDGAVDAARHRDEYAARGGRGKHLVGSSRARQRPVQRVGSELSGVPLGGRQPTDRLVDLLDPNPRRLRDRLPLDHLGHGRRSRPRRPASLRIEAHRGNPLVVDDERDPREIAAGRAAGRAAEGALGRGSEPRLITQVVLEDLSTHAAKRRRARRRGTKKGPSAAVAAPGFDPLKKRVGASSGSHRTKRDRPPRRLCWVKRWDGSRTGSSLGATVPPQLGSVQIG